MDVTSPSRFDLLDRIRLGFGALIVQSYTEVNKKCGTEWEASRIVNDVGLGVRIYSIIKVGTKKMDLKARVLGATGAGVIGRHYKIQSSDVTFSGTPDHWYNYNTAVPFATQPESTLWPSSQVTFVTPVANLAVAANQIFADIHAVTNAQNQGAGIIPAPFGGNHILNPGDIILLEIESLDAAQKVTARLDMYEGELDFIV